MSNQKKPIKLVQVSNVSALMKDGTQLSWIAYRPASAPAGSKPTLYVVTLPANLAEDPLSSYNLQVIGAQSTAHQVEVTVRNNPSATFYIPGQPPITPGNNVPVILPVVGASGAAVLKFEGHDCTLEARPLPSGGDFAAMSGDGDDPPPPPYPI